MWPIPDIPPIPLMPPMLAVDVVADDMVMDMGIAPPVDVAEAMEVIELIESIMEMGEKRKEQESG